MVDPGRARGPRWGRRGKLLLAAGTVAFVATAAFLLRPAAAPAPYTPGHEREHSEEITHNLRRSLPADLPAVTFTDAAAEAGIHFRHFPGRRTGQLPEDMGSGLAWGDYDGDGDPDLFLVNESGPLGAPGAGRGALYRNEGDGRFADVTSAAGLDQDGLGMGAAWADYDGDRDLDLAVSRFGTLSLWRNLGQGRFEDVSEASGIDAFTGFWTGISWGDYDRDGLPDLYVCGYVQYRADPAESGRSSRQFQAVVPFTLNPSSYPPERNLLLGNQRGRFRDVAGEAGVDNPAGRSLSATWADFDQDGWPDIYVANDVSDNAMFRNLGNGRFEDVSHPAWVADYRGAMGLAVGDWENDGDLDIFITHWLAQENALYENQRADSPAGSPLRFVDQADTVGLGEVSLDFVGWGTEMLDYDDDGRLDLFAANGSTFQREDDPTRLIAMRNQLFWNGGFERGFFEVGQASGASFALENVARGAAAADYDGDGDLDLAVGVNGGETRLLRNQRAEAAAAASWLRVVLRGPARPSGSGPRTSTFAIGALVRARCGETSRLRVVGGSSSYLSQSPPGEVHFGLGGASRVDALEVEWPDGRRDAIPGIPARSTVRLTEGEPPLVEAAR